MTASSQRLYKDAIPLRQKIARGIWQAVWALFFVTTPDPFFGRWRIFLLRSFGARIGRGCKVQSTCRIWAPWNLYMGDYACLASGVDCYNVATITLGEYSTVSQRSFICTASHDITTLVRPLTYAPIEIGRHAWVCAEAYVGPGVTIGEGAVLAARGAAIADLESWTVYGGLPARRIADRMLRDEDTLPEGVTLLHAVPRQFRP